MTTEAADARFRWLPKILRPPVTMNVRAERVILLVGAAAFFAGYDQNVFGLAAPRILADFGLPDSEVGPTVAIFRIATVIALLIAASADLIGRRRLLLVTLCGQALFTLFTAFTLNGVAGARLGQWDTQLVLLPGRGRRIDHLRAGDGAAV